MSNYGLKIVLLVLFLLCIRLIYELRNTHIALKNCTINERAEKNISNILINDLITQFNYNSKVANGKKEILYSLRKHLGGKPKLFLGFNESSCESCVDLALAELNKLDKIISNKNIILLTRFKNERDAYYLSRRLNGKFIIFNTKNENDIILGDNYSNLAPNFFVLTSNLQVQFFHIYSLTSPSLNKEYFIAVSNFFNSMD
jgi:hypothetical protein